MKTIEQNKPGATSARKNNSSFSAARMKRKITVACIWLTGLLAVSGFAVSAVSLVGEAASRGASLPWLIPVLLDGSLIVMTLVHFQKCIFNLSGQWKSGLLVAGFTCLTVYLNLVHGGVGIPDWANSADVASWVASVVIHSLGPVAIWINSELVSEMCSGMFADAARTAGPDQTPKNKPRRMQPEDRAKVIPSYKSVADAAAGLGVSTKTIWRDVNKFGLSCF